MYEDVIDAVCLHGFMPCGCKSQQLTALDHMDGGFTLCICCPDAILAMPNSYLNTLT